MDFIQLCKPSHLLIAAMVVLMASGTIANSPGGHGYVYCATYPEMLGATYTGRVHAVDMIHKSKRVPCSSRPYEVRRYRTYDGTCNNGELRGASFTPLKRHLSPSYQGNDGPRVLGRRDKKLPSARDISRKVHNTLELDTNYTAMLANIGQFASHDITVVPVPTARNNTIKCCGVNDNNRFSDCFPIEIPPDDHRFKTCMEFVRSEPVRHENGSIVKPRHHENGVTSYLDLSTVYGSDTERAMLLRTKNGKGALLKMSTYKGKERLPEGSNRTCANVRKDDYCPLAGDDRVSLQPMLTSLQTVFAREHNRIVRKLVAALLHSYGMPSYPIDIDKYLWEADDYTQEKIYQIARKISIAVWQNIFYGEWLPLILGPALMNKYRLWVGERVSYDPKVDSSIEYAFNTACFRFGHSLVYEHIFTDQELALKDMFGESRHTLEHHEKIAFGMISKLSQTDRFDRWVTESLVDHLFHNSIRNNSLDLASLNIQRGRDHGIQPYNAYRKFFGFEPYYSWEQFGEAAEILKSLYDHIDDVDLFTGGLNEPPVPYGHIGELLGECVALQFHDLKFGDRHYFETDNHFYGFTDEELYSLSKLKLNKVFCENAELRYIQVNTFRMPDFYNPIFACKDLPDIDVTPWLKYFQPHY